MQQAVDARFDLLRSGDIVVNHVLASLGKIAVHKNPLAVHRNHTTSYIHKELPLIRSLNNWYLLQLLKPMVDDYGRHCLANMTDASKNSILYYMSHIDDTELPALSDYVDRMAATDMPRLISEFL